MSRLPWRSLSLRLAAGLVLWWILTEGSLDKPWLALLSALAASSASLWLWPPNAVRWRPLALLNFLPYFFWQSFLGGVDVARRAFAPSLPLQPCLRRFELRLTSAPARAFLAWTVTLLPGTASVELQEHHLQIHLLAPEYLRESQLRRLEAKVAAVFGETADQH